MNRGTASRVGLLLLLVLGVGWALLHRDDFSAEALGRWVQSFGLAGPLVFMAAYALATVLFLPGAVLTLAGGALFGTIWGTVYSLTGATVGAVLAFLIARYIVSDWLAQRLDATLPNLMRGIQAEGWKFVAFVRLVPIFPFNVLNYALGLTQIKFSHYVLASYVFMLPGAAAYSYLGYIGREAAAGRTGVVHTGLITVGVVALMSFLPIFIKKLRSGKYQPYTITAIDAATLKQRLDTDKDFVVLDVRNADEYAGPLGHLVGAINIPLADLPSRLNEIEPYHNRPIAVVCLSDKRSTQAIHFLRGAGFPHLVLLRGGMKEWNSARLPVEFVSKRPMTA
ncbi:MAG: VTT domain-containing protein [Gammaproteobacteria bacterium]|nr:VTT domain-containing protein [Gammaproteobacteria bacterium]